MNTLLVLAMVVPTAQAITDIPYREMEGVDAKFHSLDIYVPEGEGPFPVMVTIHGGGWRKGDKRGSNMREKVALYHANGFVLVSINYRLSPAVKHPAHVEDVAAALAWIHDHISDYRGNPDALFVTGHSAGAHLATLVAVDEKRLGAYEKPLSIIRGVISSDHAAFDMLARLEAIPRTETAFRSILGNPGPVWADFSPITHLDTDKGIPPFLLFWTTRPAAPESNNLFLNALEELGLAGEGVEVETTHAGMNQFLSKPDNPYSDRLFAFLNTILHPTTP